MTSGTSNNYMAEYELDEDLNEIFLARPSADDSTIQTFKQSSIPKIADFNIWNRSLSTDQMMRWTGCKLVKMI